MRFSETEYYNINYDQNWVRFMGITDRGSYYSEVPRGTGKSLRENRARFKELTLEAMKKGENPCQFLLS